MTDSHGTLLKRFFDCWVASDLDGALACVADEAVFEPDLKGTQHVGKAALGALWGKYMEMMQSYAYETLSLVEGDGVAMLERLEEIGSSTGKELRLPIVGVFRFAADGRICHWRDYWDTSMAPAH